MGRRLCHLHGGSLREVRAPKARVDASSFSRCWSKARQRASAIRTRMPQHRRITVLPSGRIRSFLLSVRGPSIQMPDSTIRCTTLPRDWLNPLCLTLRASAATMTVTGTPACPSRPVRTLRTTATRAPPGRDRARSELRCRRIHPPYATAHRTVQCRAHRSYAQLP